MKITYFTHMVTRFEIHVLAWWDVLLKDLARVTIFGNLERFWESKRILGSNSPILRKIPKDLSASCGLTRFSCRLETGPIQVVGLVINGTII